ncbi:MAG: hypothetical protein FWC50_05585 [Planctomycetaceae bacterium]|nr:hypothetical protein [Planctomycetaceae bacterium]
MHNQHASSPRIFFSAGEPSGDAHAASLIRELFKQEPRLQVVGFGGPAMEKAGMTLLYDLTQKAVMYFGGAIANLLTFKKLYEEAKQCLAKHPVQAVVLVDYPGFNWWIAKAAKSLGIPVYYFMPPQLWAWGGWRIKKMRKLVRHTFATLPFEARWFQSHGCETTEIGHPFLEEAKHQKIDTQFIAGLRNEKYPILAVLPGSRDQEIKANLNDMLNAVVKIRQSKPNVRPMIAAFKQSHADLINQALSSKGLALPVFVGKTQELIRAAHFALAVSGSVSMELLANTVPSVIYYRIGKTAHVVQRFLRRTRFITLVNMLNVDLLTPNSIYFRKDQKIIPASPSDLDWDEMVFPEFLVSSDRSEDVADIFLGWLENHHEYQSVRDQLQRLCLHLNHQQSPFVVAAKVLLRRIASENFVDAPAFLEEREDAAFSDGPDSERAEKHAVPSDEMTMSSFEER